AATTAAPVAATTAAATAAPATPRAELKFAVTTRVMRTRAEAEQVAAAMGALLQTIDAGAVHTDILPVQDDWRVVGWPFARRQDADKARALLSARGMRVQVIAF
ncbi:MAG: hypothetical protein KGL18_02830, partial [Burkholderiales bacterium]|nr:hypothetical protein [Burkholderiales bacterium]